MNDSETNHTHKDLLDQVATLQRQTFTLLLALIVVAGTMVVYLWYQSHVASSSLAVIRPQARQLIDAYAKVNHTSVENFANQIGAYAVKHPEFQPILEKYGWHPPATSLKK